MRDAYVGARKEIKAQGKRRKFFAIVVIILFFALIGAALYAIVYSPLFQVRAFTVSGINDGDAVLKDIKNQISAVTLAGVLGTRNILLWNELQAKEFLAKHPEFQFVRIVRDFFSRNVVVEIVSREKFGIWCAADSCLWFSSDGVLSSHAPRVAGNLMLVVKDGSIRTLRAGDTVLDKRHIAPLFSIFDFIKQTELPARAFELKPLYLEEIWATPVSGELPAFYFSFRSDPRFALSAISELKINPGLINISYIDLRIPGKMYYKTK